MSQLIMIYKSTFKIKFLNGPHFVYIILKWKGVHKKFPIKCNFQVFSSVWKSHLSSKKHWLYCFNNALGNWYSLHSFQNFPNHPVICLEYYCKISSRNFNMNLRTIYHNGNWLVITSQLAPNIQFEPMIGN